jgi:hypothetical protein
MKDMMAALDGQLKGAIQALSDVDDYIAFAGTVLGKRIAGQKRDDLEAVRSKYLGIDPSKPLAMLDLAKNQARERQIQEDLEMLEITPERRAELASVVDRIRARIKSASSLPAQR